MSRQATRQIAATIGANVRAARGTMTQRSVAEALEIPSIYVSRWERGENVPDGMNQQKLADLFFEGDVSALYRDDSKTEAAA